MPAATPPSRRSRSPVRRRSLSPRRPTSQSMGDLFKTVNVKNEALPPGLFFFCPKRTDLSTEQCFRFCRELDLVLNNEKGSDESLWLPPKKRLYWLPRALGCERNWIRGFKHAPKWVKCGWPIATTWVDDQFATLRIALWPSGNVLLFRPHQREA